MSILREVRLEKNSETTFEIMFFFTFRKAPISLWISTETTRKEFLSTLLDFQRKVISEII